MVSFKLVYELLAKEEEVKKLDIDIHYSDINQYIYDVIEFKHELQRLVNCKNSKNLMKFYGIDEDELEYMESLIKKLNIASDNVAHYLIVRDYEVSA